MCPLSYTFTSSIGAKNVLHDQKFRQSSTEADKLCNLCRNQGNERGFDLEENIETFGGAKNPNARGALKNDAENSKGSFFSFFLILRTKRPLQLQNHVPDAK